MCRLHERFRHRRRVEVAVAAVQPPALLSLLTNSSVWCSVCRRAKVEEPADEMDCIPNDREKCGEQLATIFENITGLAKQAAFPRLHSRPGSIYKNNAPHRRRCTPARRPPQGTSSCPARSLTRTPTAVTNSGHSRDNWAMVRPCTWARWRDRPGGAWGCRCSLTLCRSRAHPSLQAVRVQARCPDHQQACL